MPKRSNEPVEQPAEDLATDAVDPGAEGRTLVEIIESIEARLEKLELVTPAEQPVELVTGTIDMALDRWGYWPNIGQVVHFVLPSGAHRPADILDVNEDGTAELLVKTLYADQVGQLLEWSRAVFEEKGITAYTWHWPEYVPAKPAEPAGPTGDPETATEA